MIDLSVLREDRRMRKTSQQVMAKDLNITQGYLSGIERGLKRPSLELLCEISNYLDCDVKIVMR